MVLQQVRIHQYLKAGDMMERFLIYILTMHLLVYHEHLSAKAISTINDPSLKLIIAPHEIDQEHIAQVQMLFPDSILYSQLKKGNGQQAGDNPSSNIQSSNIPRLRRTTDGQAIPQYHSKALADQVQAQKMIKVLSLKQLSQALLPMSPRISM